MKKIILAIGMMLVWCIYGVTFFVASDCNAASYPTSTTTPLANDLSMNQYKLNEVGDIISKGPWVDVRAYASINAAVSAIGTTQATLLIPNAQTLTATLPIPLTLSIKILKGGSIVKASTYTLTISGPFEAGLYQVFSDFAKGDVTFGPGAVEKARPEWWGLAEAASATVNAVALQSAIDSNAPSVSIPNGSFSYDTGITINRAIKFSGAGSCEENGQAGTSTTKLIYTGASVAIDVIASGTNGKENIHLSDFSLVGTSSASGGLLLGSGVNLTKSSFKNIHISSFTKVGAYGLQPKHCLESVFENVYAQSNYDGIVVLPGSGNTTLLFQSCYSRANYRYGWYLAGGINTSSFVKCSSASNDYEGLYIYGINATVLSFYNWYSENNQRLGGLAPIVITGSSVVDSSMYINFFGGSAYDNVAGRYVDLDYAQRIIFHDFIWSSTNSGFMKVTANTLHIVVNTPYTESARITHNITGNTGQAMVFGNEMPSKLTAALRDAITTPFEGETIFNSTTNKLNAYNGTAWEEVEVVSNHLSATAVLDFNLSTVNTQDLTVTVSGAAIGDTVAIGVPNASLTASTLFWGWVSAADTVKVRAMRISGTPNPLSGTFRVDVWKH